MNKNLTLYKIFIIYKNEFAGNLKEAYNSVKNSRQFNSHTEILELESNFADLGYLTSYETFGKLEDLIVTEDIDNRTNFLRFKSALPTFNNIINEIHTYLKSLIKTLKEKERNINKSKDHLDLYRIANSLHLLSQIEEVIPDFFTYFDAAKALLALGFHKDVSYIIKELTFSYITEILEVKEHQKIQKNIEKMQGFETFHKRQKKKQLTLENEKKEIDFNTIIVYCGPDSSDDTLATKEDYINALHKKINTLFKDMKAKQFILPKFYFHLRNFIFDQIKTEMKEKGTLYLIDNRGNHIFPYDIIKKEIYNFFDKHTKKLTLTSSDFKEQEQKIEDDIFFEIANIENLLSKELSNSTTEEKKLLILRYLRKSSANVYKYLLPETKKIEHIIENYLRSH